MKANTLCPPPNLEAADLEGKDVVVTIKEVGFKIVGDKQVNKGVIHLEEFDRPLVLNRTNLKRTIDHHGNDTDAWKGKKITLYPSETDFQGKTVPCLRVREKK